VTEFDLIYKLLNTQSQQRADVLTGIGDDCAILSVPENHSLAVSMDTLVAGVHFPESASAFSIGYKSLAVNLSDLAAAGAIPAWFTLSLTMPAADENWVKEFVRGLFTLADKHNVQLIGGDTCKGPLSISIQAHGFVKNAMLRSGAKAGDLIYVSESIGDAALGLKSYQGDTVVDESCIKQFNQPEPRIRLGLAINDYATACIDISDGLISDITHICKQSQCGADIYLNKIPLSDAYQRHYNSKPDIIQALSFGDDYELCFTIDKSNEKTINKISRETGHNLTCIGTISTESKVRCFNQNNEIVDISRRGFEHFNG